jgi:serine/threonine protein kinase/Tol biopolymer transport system component
MSFTTGTILGHYKVLEQIGAGGMGEIFKASDTRLDRPVALKILPAHLVTDSDRVRRFVGEAKAASGLNHPHIITIYEIGEVESGGSDPNHVDSFAGLVHYIAMEYVSGATLHVKIHREHIELKKLLEYFAQAADGLAKAHGVGIVHRDLKPENIMITDDGYAKILDFGLAKLIEPGAPADQSSEDAREAATAMMEHTRPGMVMGTIGYMSPEQAQGKPVDPRSDIFSFGCILYEAATGQKPFQGDSVIDSLHKIVYSQAPAIRDNNPDAPAELQRIIRKCLAKDPAERYQSIKDIALDLRDLIKEYDSLPRPSGPSIPQPGSTQTHPSITAQHSTQFSAIGAQVAVTGPNEALSSGSVSAITQSPGGTRRWIALGGVLIAIAAIAIALYLILDRRPDDLGGPVFQNAAITKLTSTGRSAGAVISPDGKYVVHILNEAGKQGLWVRQTATSSNAPVVPPDDGNFVGVTFSNDGNYVYFVKGEKGATIRSLYQVPVLGGSPKKLIEDVDSAITFAPDGKRFAFVRHSTAESALLIVNADGSGEQKLLSYKQPDLFQQLAWSPDGSVIAASTRKLSGGFRAEAVAVQVSDGSEKTIGTQKWRGIGGIAWLAGGHSLAICAVDQTPGSGQFQVWQLAYPTGQPRRITNDLNNYAGVSLSSDSSTLVTVQSDAVTNIWVAPGGDAARARQITSGSSRYNQISFSSDGRRLVYLSDASGTADIWVMDSDGKNQKQLTSDAGVNAYAAVSPDGRYIVFDSNRAGNLMAFNVWRMGVDGSSPRQITQGEGEYFPACSADSQWVIYTPLSANGNATLWKIPIDGGDPVQLSDRLALRAAVSPDGKWIACQSIGDPPNPRPKIAIFPFEGGQPAKLLDIPFTQQIQFRWSADGKAILYLDDREGVSNVWSQPVAGGAPRQVTNFTADRIFSFDWSRDGKQMACARGVVTTDVIMLKDPRRAEARP